MHNIVPWDQTDNVICERQEGLADGAGTIESRYQELALLHEISQAVLGTTDLSALADQFVAGAMRVGAYDIGLLRLARNDGAFEVAAHRGYRDAANIPPTETDPQQKFHVPTDRTSVVEDISLNVHFPRMER